MALRDILEQIGERARLKAKEISRAAEKEVAAIESAAEEKILARTAEEEKKLRSELERRRNAALSRARRRAAMIVSAARREAVNQVYEEVSRQLTSSREHYRRLLAGMFAKLPADAFASEEVRLFVPVGRETVTAEEAVKIFPAAEKAKIEADEKLTAGFVLRGKDFSYDFSLSGLLERYRAELDAIIAEELFSQQ